LVGQKVVKAPGLKKGAEVTEDYLNGLDESEWFDVKVSDAKVSEQIDQMADQVERQRKLFDERFEDKKKKITSGDDLAPGVLKMVKVYLAVKRRIQPGDKMAGRHGNKGVISMVVPEEDMPFDKNGRPVDIVLNPLGVPSRMNIGQVLEVHLGWAARGLGDKITEMLEKNEKANNLREFLTKIYNIDKERVNLDELNDDEIMELA
ncbi:MAG: hypothetical protein KDA57_23875, partial [Planctomycetales bacterium]|nr:hypothetical protein [Planctomycetales bacterium]